MDAAISASIDWVGVCVASGTQGTDLEAIQANQVQSLLEFVGCTKLDLPEATRSMHTLNATTAFTASHKTELNKAITNKVNGGEVRTSSKPKQSDMKQEHLYIYNYLPATIWDALEDTTASDDDRVDVLADFVLDVLGLPYPNVNTEKVMVMILNDAQKRRNNMQGYKDLYDKINAAINRKRSYRTQRSFPVNVEDFIRLYPDRYDKDDPPIATRVCAKRIRENFESLPARNTHKRYRKEIGALAPIVQQPSPNEFAQMPSMQAFMGQAIRQGVGMLLQQQGMGNNGGGLNIDFDCRSRRQSQPQMSLGDGQAHDQRLSLEDRKPSLSPTPSPSAIRKSASSSSIGDVRMRSEELDVETTPGKVSDDIDDMLNSAMDGKAAGTTKKRVLKRPAAATAPEFTKRPAFGTAPPLVYKKCRVYDNGSKFRVYPDPNSVYDKGFQYNEATKKYIWEAAMDFCEKPLVPKASVNQPSKKK